MERDRCGYAFKCFVTKEFKESMAYINNYCAQVVQTRQRESTEQLTARTDLLSKMLLAGKVRGGMRTWYLSTATEDCQPRASEVCRFLPSPSLPRVLCCNAEARQCHVRERLGGVYPKLYDCW